MSYLKNNFNGGEVGRHLRYRADIAKFANCEEALENFFVLPQGGIENRPGTIRVAEARENAPVRLIPFQFNNDERFCLEFGDGYIRVVGAEFVLPSPYRTSDLEPIRCTQKNDILFLAHPKYSPRMLKRFADSWTLETLDPVGGPWLDTGGENGITLTASNVSGDVTITSSADLFTEDMKGARIRLLHVRKENGFTHKFSADGDISTGTGAKRENCFGAWKFRSYGSWVGTLTLLRSTDGGATWKTYRTYVSNADDNADDGGYEEEMGVLFSCKLENWQDPPAGVLYECRVTFTHEDFMHQGDATITGVSGPRAVTAAVDHNFYSQDPAEEWSFDAWNDHQGYPSQVAFHSGDRLVFASTKLEPQTLYFSAVGDYGNFTPGTQADNAMTLTLNTGRYNSIRWLCEMGEEMYLGCANGVIRLSSTDKDAPIAPGKVRAIPSGATGVAPLAPAASGEAILFVRRGGRALMEFAYQYSDDVYRTPEMSILNPDILDAGVKELHLRQSPYPMLLALRTDGVLCCFTYNRSEEVMAWSRIVPARGGVIESLCVLDTDDREDEVYLAVSREGSRTIERLAPRLDAAPGEGCYLDCAAEASSAYGADVFTLPELAGTTVTVNADGVVHRGVAVDGDGKLALPTQASHIWAGYEYECVMRTLPLELAQGAQGTLNVTKRAVEGVVKFCRTWGAELSVSSDGRPVELAARQLPTELDSPIDRESQDIGITLFNAPRREQQIEVRQHLPLPLTLLALLIETE